jgi:cyclophilin family peptidyl-prolyl cis-trans isomerase
MARDAAPDTATSEYFVNIEANPKLDYTGPDHRGYAVFGRIVEGTNVVDKIKAVETQTNPDPELKGEKSQPINPPVLEKARRIPPQKP